MDRSKQHMRRFFAVLAVVLFSTALALAQGPPSGSPGKGNGNGHGNDDHDDNGPVQSGYAVITPSSTTASGMVVFETFGQRRGNSGSATQAGVLPPDLTTNAILFVDSSGRLSRNLAVAIVNPNTAAVSVTMTLKKDDGVQLATKTTSIPSHQQIAAYVTDLFSNTTPIPSDLTGTLSIVTTGGPVSVIGL